MRHDSNFHFSDSVLIIAFICQQAVEHEQLCAETYQNFYRQTSMELPFLVGILATQDSFLDPETVQVYKQIRQRLQFLLDGTQNWQSYLDHRQLSSAEYPH
jgi:hypothetical protein